MKKYFYMLPRCSGKTNMAIYEFLKDPENTLLVVCNHDLLQYVYDKIGYKHENVITNRRFASFIVNKRFKTIILDEYLLFSNYREIYDTSYTFNSVENLFIYTTSNKQYKKSVFNMVKENKEKNHPYSYHILDYAINMIKKTYNSVDFCEIIGQIQELYYNFLTDPDTILIDKIPTTFETKTIDRSCFQNDKQYDIEILNKWLIDDGENKDLPLYDMPKDNNKVIVDTVNKKVKMRSSNDEIIIVENGEDFVIFYGGCKYSTENGKIELIY